MAAAGGKGKRAQTAPVVGARKRILRIGVLLGGKIVEERLIRERVAVSIGQSVKNTFSIPVDGLPLEHVLFAVDNDRYYLQFLNKMDGRLGETGGQVTTLDALKRNGAEQRGATWRVRLAETARGKLSIGELTVLFQFVVEPPRQPKPMLPASVRGTLADRIDPQLAVILAISILLHMSIAVGAWWREPDVPDTLVDRAYNLTFKPDTYQVEVATPEPVEAQTGSAAGSAQAEKGPDTPPSRTPPRPGAGGGRSAGEHVATSTGDAHKYADLLAGEGAEGTATGDMSTRRPGADLAAQIDDVREGNKTIAEGFGGGRTSRGDGDPRTGTGRGPGIEGPGQVAQTDGGKTTERVPSGRIKVSSKSTDDDSDLTPDAVLRRINQAYMAGIKRCYTNFLKKEASARGAVKLSFEVNPTGRALNGRAVGFADEVDACITSLMASWRFPIPKDKDGDPTSAGFGITLQLLPE